MKKRLKLPHHLVHHIVLLASMVLVQFPLGGVGSLCDMLGDMVESRVIQMLDRDVHMLQVAGDSFICGDIFTRDFPFGLSLKPLQA